MGREGEEGTGPQGLSCPGEAVSGATPKSQDGNKSQTNPEPLSCCKPNINEICPSLRVQPPAASFPLLEIPLRSWGGGQKPRMCLSAGIREPKPPPAPPRNFQLTGLNSGSKHFSCGAHKVPPWLCRHVLSTPHTQDNSTHPQGFSDCPPHTEDVSDCSPHNSNLPGPAERSSSSSQHEAVKALGSHLSVAVGRDGGTGTGAWSEDSCGLFQWLCQPPITFSQVQGHVCHK